MIKSIELKAEEICGKTVWTWGDFVIMGGGEQNIHIVPKENFFKYQYPEWDDIDFLIIDPDKDHEGAHISRYQKGRRVPVHYFDDAI